MARTKSSTKKRSTATRKYKRVPNVVRNQFSVYQTLDGDDKGRYKKACDLVCIRCLYRKAAGAGARCKNIVCFGLPYCPDHMKIMYNLELKPIAATPEEWKSETDPRGFFDPAFNKQYDPAKFRVFAIDEVPKDTKKDNTQQIVFQQGEIIISNEDSNIAEILKKELKYAGKIPHGRLNDTLSAPSQFNLGADKSVDYTCVRSLISMLRFGIETKDGGTYNVDFIKEPPGLGIVALRDILHGEELLLAPGNDLYWGDPMSAKYLPDQKAGYAIVRKRKGQTLPNVLRDPVRGWGVSARPRRRMEADMKKLSKKSMAAAGKYGDDDDDFSLGDEDEFSFSEEDDLSDSDDDDIDMDSDDSDITSSNFRSSMRDNLMQWRNNLPVKTPAPPSGLSGLSGQSGQNSFLNRSIRRKSFVSGTEASSLNDTYDTQDSNIISGSNLSDLLATPGDDIL
jgi:hypothetical protein